MFKSLNLKSLKKTKNQQDQPVSKFIAILMWSMVLMGYILFVVNWTAGSLISGNTVEDVGKKIGWASYFFNGKIPSVTAQSVSYSITLVRGLFSLIIAWIMVKISHKWAVTISLGLLSFGLISAFMPNYGLFIASRALMAIGGTMLIVYLQPIIARFFKGKSRAFVSSVSVQGYTTAGLISFGLILNSNVRNFLLQNWSTTIAVIGGLSLVPTILYLIFGRNFNITAKSEGQKEGVLLKPQTYKEIIKESQTIVWCLWYGFWLVIAVLSTFVLPKILTQTFEYLKKETVQASGFEIKWAVLGPFLFFVGAFAGIGIGYYNRFNVKRKPFLLLLSFLKLVMLILIIIGAKHEAPELTYFAFFVLGALVFGTQGIFFNVPHEYEGSSPRRVIVLFSYVWGFGYIIYTLSSVVANGLLDSVEVFGSPAGAGWMSLAFTIFCFILAIFFAALIKESRPNSPTWPKLNYTSRRMLQA